MRITIHQLRRIGAEVYDVFTDGGVVQRLLRTVYLPFRQSHSVQDDTMLNFGTRMFRFNMLGTTLVERWLICTEKMGLWGLVAARDLLRRDLLSLT